MTAMRPPRRRKQERRGSLTMRRPSLASATGGLLGAKPERHAGPEASEMEMAAWTSPFHDKEVDARLLVWGACGAAHATTLEALDRRPDARGATTHAVAGRESCRSLARPTKVGVTCSARTWAADRRPASGDGSVGGSMPSW